MLNITQTPTTNTLSHSHIEVLGNNQINFKNHNPSNSVDLNLMEINNNAKQDMNAFNINKQIICSINFNEPKVVPNINNTPNNDNLNLLNFNMTNLSNNNSLQVSDANQNVTAQNPSYIEPKSNNNFVEQQSPTNKYKEPKLQPNNEFGILFF